MTNECEMCDNNTTNICVYCGANVCTLCCISSVYCAYSCQIDHLFNRCHYTTIHSILSNIQMDTKYTKNIQIHQQLIYDQCIVQKKKWIVWTTFYLKQYLIKDIANIVSEY